MGYVFINRHIEYSYGYNLVECTHTRKRKHGKVIKINPVEADE